MMQENFNKAPGSEFSSKYRDPNEISMNSITQRTTQNLTPAASDHISPPLKAGVSLSPDILPYAILQYGQILPTIVQPSFSMYHPPAPPPQQVAPLPITMPVFYQTVNSTAPPPMQTFDANLYRYLPQHPNVNDPMLQRFSRPKTSLKTGTSTRAKNCNYFDCIKPEPPSFFHGDTNPSSPLALQNTADCPLTSSGFGVSEIVSAGRAGTKGLPLNPDRLIRLTELAMQGCELAEKLANHHQKRPCFKKIDSLCARMKQDLIRPDNVLANINSQGVAWAVKDFIFVFTRVINAWIIIKGYVYNTPDGLERVQGVLAADFLDNFLKWQDCTIDFADSLIKSFTNLDQMVQNQKTNSSSTSKDPKATIVSRPTKLDELENERCVQELYGALGLGMSNSVDSGNFNETTGQASGLSDNASSSGSSEVASERSNTSKGGFVNPLSNESDETQVKHYFKTGIYEPARKPPGFGAVTPKPIATMTMPTFTSVLVDDSPRSAFVTSTPKILKNPLTKLRPNLYANSATTSNSDSSSSDIELTAASIERLGLPKVRHFQMEFFSDAIIRQTFDNETVARIHFLLQKVFKVPEAEYFLVGHFTKNYFPDFLMINPNFIDLRTIISKTQIGGYANIQEIVRDLRQIVSSAHHYLEQKANNSLLRYTIEEFERSLEDILSDKIFDCYDNFSNSFNRANVSSSLDENSNSSNNETSSGKDISSCETSMMTTYSGEF